MDWLSNMKAGRTTRRFTCHYPTSIIIIIAALLIKISYDAIMFFVITLFVIGSVTLVIKNLIDLQKKWKNG